MNQKNDESPLHRTASRLVFELLKLDHLGGAPNPAVDLEKVKSLRTFMSSPASPEEGASMVHALQTVPGPAGTSLTMVNGCPFNPGDVVTQKVPAQGDTPAYLFPLPGQPVRVLGAPRDFAVPDGSRWDEETSRWSCEDLRVLIATPGGPLVLTVDSEEFNPWTPFSPKWEEIEAERDVVLGKIQESLETILKNDGEATK